MKLKHRIIEQASFSFDLSKNLMRDIQENFSGETVNVPIYSHMEVANKTQMINDVIRLRRELLRLEKYLKCLC